MADIAQIREVIAGLPLEDARRATLKMVRRAVRAIIFRYAQKNRIMDFDELILVEPRHRDWRQTRIDIATARASEVQAASTIEELLVVYDSIAAWLGA